MIVSVSRRTDIPAYYSEWFVNRVRAGYCTVPNPMYPEKLSLVSLRPEDVDCFVFCTRNPRPLMRYLPELDSRGYRYYFQYTLLGQPREIDPHSPPRKAALDTFKRLADRVGATRMVWRYDPIAVSEITPPEYHVENYGQIAAELEGAACRSVVSILDPYRKTERRMTRLAAQGVHLKTREELPEPVIGQMMTAMVESAHRHGMEIVSCAEEPGLERYGIKPGKCIDDELIQHAFGVQVDSTKNPSMRKVCGCVMSRDIGMYDACLFGCSYCYATSSFERARANYWSHDPRSPSLLGWFDAPEPVQAGNGQMALF